MLHLPCVRNRAIIAVFAEESGHVVAGGVVLLSELEAGGLNTALHRYVQEANDFEDRESRRASLTAAGLPLQPQDDEETFRKAAAKLGSGAINAAKALLIRTVKTPLTEDTARRIDGLVAVPIDAEEDTELKE